MVPGKRPPVVTMALLETDRRALEGFLARETPEGPVHPGYLVLQDFAVDCQRARHIQPELLGYLLPFYENTLEQAVLGRSKTARDVYPEWNAAWFFNREVLRPAAGEAAFRRVMDRYVRLTLANMERHPPGISPLGGPVQHRRRAGPGEPPGPAPGDLRRPPPAAGGLFLLGDIFKPTKR